jgi:ABC-2 type transporter
VSIALELSARPQVLILDEVTSGLDSYTAHRLMVTLKSVAQTHARVLVTSIHQPSHAIFSMLDRLLLLAEGTTVFSGPAAQLEGALARASLPSPPNTPTADWLLAIVNEPEKMDRLVASAIAKSARAQGRAEPLNFGTRLRSRRGAPLLYQLGILVRAASPPLCPHSLVGPLWLYGNSMLPCCSLLAEQQIMNSAAVSAHVMYFVNERASQSLLACFLTTILAKTCPSFPRTRWTCVMDWLTLCLAYSECTCVIVTCMYIKTWKGTR